MTAFFALVALFSLKKTFLNNLRHCDPTIGQIETVASDTISLN